MLDSNSLQELVRCTKKASLLYVEDNIESQKQTLKLLVNIFDETNITVCENGLDALNQYKKNKFDFILSDVTMPIMDGIRLAKEVLRYDTNATIVLLTAYNDDEFLENIKDVDIFQYIAKPIDFEKFITLLVDIKEKKLNCNDSISEK